MARYGSCVGLAEAAGNVVKGLARRRGKVFPSAAAPDQVAEVDLHGAQWGAERARAAAHLDPAALRGAACPRMSGRLSHAGDDAVNVRPGPFPKG